MTGPRTASVAHPAPFGNSTHPAGQHCAAVMLVALIAAACHFAFVASIPDLLGADRSHPFLTNGQSFSLAQAFALKTWLYRPLSIFVEHNTAALYFHNEHRYHLLVVGAVSLLNGIQAGLVYHVASRLSGSVATALACTILATFSAASLAASWFGLYAFFELGPLLAITTGIACYIEYRATGRLGYLAGVLAAGLVASWFREIGILLASALLALELARVPTKPTAALPVAVALMLHGLFPTALPHIFGFYPDEILFLLDQAEIKANFAGGTINWLRAGRLMNEVPSILWLGAGLAAALFVRDELARGFRPLAWYRAACAFGVTTGEPGGNAGLTARAMGIVVAVVMAVALAVLVWSSPWPTNAAPALRAEAIPLLALVLLMAISAFRFGAVLPLWFLAGYPSLIRFPNNHETQMVFVVVPFCLLVAMWWHDLFLRASTVSAGRFGRSARTATAVAACFGLLIQIATLPAARSAIVNIRDGIQAMADWTREHVPPGSLVFVNTFAGYEYWDRTNRSVDLRWLNTFGPIHHVPNFPKTFEFARQLEEVEAAQATGKRVYYLLLGSRNEEGPYLMPAARYERVAHFDIEQAAIPFDFIRRFLALPGYGQYFGPTQWITTFDQAAPETPQGWRTSWVMLRQHDLAPSAGAKMLTADTAPRLPRMVSPGAAMLAPPISTAPPRLVIDGHKNTNYNVIFWGGRFFAAHRVEGSYQPPTDYPGRVTKRPVFVDEDLQALLAQIDADAQSRAAEPLPAPPPVQTPQVAPQDAPGALQLPPPATDQEPRELVVDGYKATNYNIIRYGGLYFAVHRGEGSYDPATDYGRRLTRLPVFAAASQNEVQAIIDTNVRPAP